MWRALVALGVCAFFLGLATGSAFAFGAVAAGSGGLVDCYTTTLTGSTCYGSSGSATSAAAVAYAQSQQLSNPAWTWTGFVSSAPGPVAVGAAVNWTVGANYAGSSNGTTTDNAQLARAQVAGGPSCPANSTGTSTCTCDDGYKPNTGATACESVGSCATIAAGLNLLNSPVQSGVVKSLTTCYGGCSMQSDFGGTGSNGSWWLFGPFRATGANCSGAAGGGDDTSPPPIACESPKCPGTVNGASVCVACSSITASGPETAASAPAGAASAPSGTTPGTSSQQTSCEGSRCVTTTTTKDPSGVTISVEVESRPQDDFCAKNPGAPQCKKSESSFGGSCVGGFQCDGDAVQCAIAREQHTRNCALYVTETPQSTAGYAALTAGDRPGDHPANDPTAEALDFSGRIDQTDRLGGGSLTDLTIPVGNLAPVVIPFSQLQSPLAMLGNLLVGVTMLWALFIVFGRAK